MISQGYFTTPIWTEQQLEWVNPLNKICDSYIEAEKNLYKDVIKEQKGSDFGIVYTSSDFTNHFQIKEYKDYIETKSWEFLDWMGYDLKDHTLVFTDLRVQEFPKDGGGYLNPHIHPNNHVSGFFYLKVDKDGSFPVFHDPRPAALSSALPQKNKEIVTYASDSFHWKPESGTLVIMPAYLIHECVVSKDYPFRFLHFNLQAIENRFLNLKNDIVECTQY